jgi:hypothetical protein
VQHVSGGLPDRSDQKDRAIGSSAQRARTDRRAEDGSNLAAAKVNGAGGVGIASSVACGRASDTGRW